MGKTKAEQKLAQYKKNMRELQSPNRDENILKLLEAEQKLGRNSSFPDFVLGQIGIVGTYGCLFEIIWLSAFLLIFFTDGLWGMFGRTESLALISASPSVLILLTAEDLSRIFHRSMMEIEKTTKYSLQQIAMMRLHIYGIMHGVAVLAGILAVSGNLERGLVELAVYGYTPFILASALLYELARRFKGENLMIAGGAICTGIFFLLAIVIRPEEPGMNRLDIYSVANFDIWKMLFVAAIAIYVFEIIVMRKELKHYEVGTYKYI